MSAAWTCASEAAVRSDSADFIAGEKACDVIAAEVDDVATALRADAGNGWEGIEGDYAVGLQAVAQLAATQVGDLGARGVEFTQIHARAAADLEALEAESDALLLAAEEVHIRYVTARDGEANSWLAANAHIRNRNAYDPDSAEWGYADAAFWRSVESARVYEAQRVAAGAELDELQTKFDGLREDEEQSDQQFADQMLAVDLTAMPIEADASGVSAAPVGLVLDALDAAAAARPARTRGTAGLERRWAISSARSLLAGVTNTDLVERDARVDTVRMTRQLRQLGPEATAFGLFGAFGTGDASGARRRSVQLLDGLGAMSSDEAFTYLNYMGNAEMYTVLALTDVPAHPAIIEKIFVLGGSPTFFGMTDEHRSILIDELGVDVHDAAYRRLIEQKAFADILSHGDIGYERLEDGLEIHEEISSLFTPELGHALRRHIVANPHLVAWRAFSENYESVRQLQRVIDVVDRGSTDVEFNDFVLSLAVSIADPKFVAADEDYSQLLGIGMSASASALGRLLYEADQANDSASFDPTALLTVLGTAGTTAVATSIGGPPLGKVATTAVKSILAMWTGIEGSQRDGNTRFEATRVQEQTIVAVAMIAAAGGPAAERLGEIAVEHPDPSDFLNYLEAGRTSQTGRTEQSGPHVDADLVRYVDRFVNDVNARIVDLSSNDG